MFNYGRRFPVLLVFNKKISGNGRAGDDGSTIIWRNGANDQNVLLFIYRSSGEERRGLKKQSGKEANERTKTQKL